MSSCCQKMSKQQQPRRPQTTDEAIKYGDVFPTVRGELASELIKPQDAAMMQSAENVVTGHTQKRGPAAAMQSAATRNERAGLVEHDDMSDFPGDRGVTVSETNLPGRTVITEKVAGQAVGQYTMSAAGATNAAAGGGGGKAQLGAATPTAPTGNSKITIGEALEAAAMTAGDKPVEQSDAAAIQAAEVRATGINNLPGGVAAASQSAADANVCATTKTTLGDILAGAAERLPSDKTVTRGDAEGVMAAELRNNPNIQMAPGGVAASMAAAARLNQEKQL